MQMRITPAIICWFHGFDQTANCSTVTEMYWWFYQKKQRDWLNLEIAAEFSKLLLLNKQVNESKIWSVTDKLAWFFWTDRRTRNCNAPLSLRCSGKKGIQQQEMEPPCSRKSQRGKWNTSNMYANKPSQSCANPSVHLYCADAQHDSMVSDTSRQVSVTFFRQQVSFNTYLQASRYVLILIYMAIYLNYSNCLWISPLMQMTWHYLNADMLGSFSRDDRDRKKMWKKAEQFEIFCYSLQSLMG